MNLDANAHQDQLVCLGCGQRANNRHNIPCTRCHVMMVYERAWAKLDGLGVIFAGEVPIDPDRVAGQLALF